MTFAFAIGNYRVTIASHQRDVLACQRLRHARFFGRDGVDRDEFDQCYRHIMILRDDQLIATCRFLTLTDGLQLNASYTSQHYDLKSISDFKKPMLEVGRLCVAATTFESDALRLIWGTLASIVDENAVEFIFGCSSFSGVNPATYVDGFSYLAEHHLGPDRRRPGQQSAEIVPLDRRAYDPRSAQKQIPPALATYLRMSGWVSDHAVIDHRMKTLHVFTGLFVADIPERRARFLRSVSLQQTSPLASQMCDA